MSRLGAAVKRFIKNNSPVRYATYQEALDKISGLETYAMLLEKHVDDGVKQITGKKISDVELAATLLILGRNVEINRVVFNSKKVAISPNARGVSIINSRFDELA